ncbi:reverse transcriptase domain-containing protein [Tanacetum coccineum]
MKATPRKLAYADSDKEAPVRSLAKGFSDRFSLESSSTSDTHRQTHSTIKSQKTPSKNKEPTHLRRSRRLENQSTTKEKARRERSKSRRKMYLFSGGRARRMADAHLVQNVPSRQTLEGAARNWFDDLDPKSVDSFEELSQNFLEEFSQQKRYAKDPTEIHGIKRRQNEGFQAFIDRFKSESSHIKGVPPVLHISAFMHGDSHPELAKKLNEKNTQNGGRMFERHGPKDLKEPETGAAQGKHEGIWGCTLLVPEKILSPRLPRLRKKSSPWKAPQHQRLLSVEEANTESRGLGKIGSSSEGHLPKQLAEGNQGRNDVKVINMIRVEGSRKRPFKEGRSGIMNELTFPAIPLSQLTDEPIILEGIIEGNQVRRILVDGGSLSEIMFFERNISPPEGNRPSSNYGKGRKK